MGCVYYSENKFANALKWFDFALAVDSDSVEA